jgi:DNA-directed RNA polymerase subunit RPC12/RpoP
MKWLYSKAPYAILFLVGFWIFVFYIFDIIYDKGWQLIIAVSYVFLIVLFFMLIILKSKQDVKRYMSVEEFEKTLKGGLYHFKCQNCWGIFAIKKTRKNDKKPVKMTCPDCGELGIIPVHPLCIQEEIPEKKSLNANFKCSKCGEGVTVWAEGTILYEDTSVLSCPFCGVEKPLRRF